MTRQFLQLINGLTHTLFQPQAQRQPWSSAASVCRQPPAMRRMRRPASAVTSRGAASSLNRQTNGLQVTDDRSGSAKQCIWADQPLRRPCSAFTSRGTASFLGRLQSDCQAASSMQSLLRASG